MRVTSPIHRLSATGGLIALVPVALLLFQDRLTLLEAGARGVAILAAVLVVRWVTDRTVRGVVSRLDAEDRPDHTSLSSSEAERLETSSTQ